MWASERKRKKTEESERWEQEIVIAKHRILGFSFSQSSSINTHTPSSLPYSLHRPSASEAFKEGTTA